MSDKKQNLPDPIVKPLQKLGEKIVDTDILDKAFETFTNSPSDRIKKAMFKLAIKYLWGQEKGELSKDVLEGFIADPECPDWLKELSQKELDSRLTQTLGAAP